MVRNIYYHPEKYESSDDQVVVTYPLNVVVPMFIPNRRTGRTDILIPSRAGVQARVRIDCAKRFNSVLSEAVMGIHLAESLCLTKRYGPVSFEHYYSFVRFADICTRLKRAESFDDFVR